MSLFECFFDGACYPNPGIMGLGWVIDGQSFSECVGFGTNNEAEYASLVHLLEALIEMAQAGDTVVIHGDSQLVVCQMDGSFAVKSPNLLHYNEVATSLFEGLVERGCSVDIGWISRDHNEAADAASKKALSDAGIELPSYAPESGYGSLTDIAEAVGKSAIMVGRVLDHAGYRNESKPTQKAWDEEIASSHPENSWSPCETIDWHLQRVTEVVQSAPDEWFKPIPKIKSAKPAMKVLEGNTYPHRETIRAAGGKWDALRKVWRVPEPEYDRLASLIHLKEA